MLYGFLFKNSLALLAGYVYLAFSLIRVSGRVTLIRNIVFGACPSDDWKANGLPELNFQARVQTELPEARYIVFDLL
jgi:hypothetical protein